MLDKKWIKKYLFTKDTNPRINNRIGRRDWWIKRNFDKELKYLEENYPFENIFQSLYHIYYTIPQSIPKCHCGNDLKFLQFKSGYRQYCSTRCSYKCDERNHKISQNRDQDTIMDKVKSYNQKTYGVDYYFQTEQFKSKSIKTKIYRYNDPKYNNKPKAEKTCMEKYGVSAGIFKSEVIKKIQKYGHTGKKLNSNTLINLNYNQKLSVMEIADSLNVTPKTIRDWAKSHDIELKTYIPNFQKLQKTFNQHLPYQEQILFNDRKSIYPKELDFFYPNHNIAIELNGLYWHANNKHRHLQKLQLCQDKKIRLLQFWDYEITEKLPIVLSIIHSSLKLSTRIFARNCKYSNINSKQYREFMNSNHIQGYAPAKIKLGLYHENKLVMVAGLSKPRFSNSKCKYELIRLATKLNVNVVGGFSKILSKIDGSIISYLDRRLFTGMAYEKSGFQFINSTHPSYFWFKKDTRLSRFQTQRHKLETLFNCKYHVDMSENEIMIQNGFQKIWDCGTNVYIKK